MSRSFSRSPSQASFSSDAEMRQLMQKQRELHEELIVLDRLCNEARATQKTPNPGAERLAAQLEEQEKLVRDAHMQKDVFEHMIGRLTEDVLEIKVRTRRRGD